MSEMTLCKGCRWWQHPAFPDIGHAPHWDSRRGVYNTTVLGRCTAAQHYWEYSLPLLENVMIETDTVIHQDDEGWGMLTGPEFGCVHWEQKL